jgi:MFS family permease
LQSKYKLTEVALIFLALTLPSFLGPFVGFLTDKVGPRWVSTFGFLLLVPVEVCLRFVDQNNIGHKVLLCALLFTIGLGEALIITPVMSDISHVVFKKEKQNPEIFGKKGAYAQAYGLFNLSFALGALVGPLWGGFVREAAGWSTLTWSLGLLSGVSAIPTAIWCGGAIYR